MSTPPPATEKTPAVAVALPATAGLPTSCALHGAGSGAVTTVKATPLLALPPTVTTTLPVVAPAGTGTTMLVADQFVGVAATPLKATVLAPCVAPKFEPAIVTGVGTRPLDGDRLVITGAGGTSNATSAEYGLINPPVL